MKKIVFAAMTALFAFSSLLAVAQPPQQQRREMPSVEERVESLREKLDLTDEQCELMIQVENLYTTEAPERGERGQRSEPSEAEREAMKAKMEERQAQMAERSAKIEEILTEKQFKKWKRIEASQQQQGPGQGQGRPSFE